VVLDFSRPGKPTDNAFIETFNGRLRQECLDRNWLLCLGDAWAKIDAWRSRDNREHPLGSVGYLAPGSSSHPWVASLVGKNEPIVASEVS
jgi:putative transposase